MSLNGLDVDMDILWQFDPVVAFQRLSVHWMANQERASLLRPPTALAPPSPEDPPAAWELDPRPPFMDWLDSFA